MEINQEILETVILSIKECLNDDTLEIGVDTHLQNDLNVDSVDAICFIMELEAIHNIAINDEEIQNLTTVKSIVIYIQEQLEKNS